VLFSGLNVISFCLLGMAVPGTPVALYFYVKSRNLALAIALTPIFSIGINFFFLQILNYAGLKVDLRIIAAIEVIATMLGTFVILKRNKPFTNILKSGFFAVAVVAPATILGIAIWQRAYSGFIFLAANQDAYNHNRWIYRIASTGSALTQDALITSPFQDLGASGGFYPLAWHSWVAVWSSVTGLTVPVASLVSVILIRARRLGAIVGTNGSTSWLDCSGVGTGVSTCARSAYDLGINDLCRRDRNIASEFGSWSLHATRDSKNHAWHLAGRSRNFILHSYP